MLYITHEPHLLPQRAEYCLGVIVEEHRTGHPTMVEHAPVCQTAASLEGSWYPPRVVLGSSWSITYSHNLRVIFLCSKAKKQKWKTAERHFLCEWLFLSDWGLALEHEEKRDEANHLWWWAFGGLRLF